MGEGGKLKQDWCMFVRCLHTSKQILWFIIQYDISWFGPIGVDVDVDIDIDVNINIAVPITVIIDINIDIDILCGQAGRLRG